MNRRPCLWSSLVRYRGPIGFRNETNAFNSFTPSIVQGLGYTAAKAQLFSVPPFAVAFVGQFMFLPRRVFISITMA